MAGSVIVVVAALLWFSWPVYQFFAHKYKVPMLPTGKLTIALESPTNQQLYVPAFTAAAEKSLALLNAHKQKIHAPAISVAVAIKGDLVWAGAVGWANIAQQTPVSTNTQFRIGSTSKAVTATALARLVDQGVIDLDSAIENYIKPLPNVQYKTITPRQLASHMAGLVHYKRVADTLGKYRLLALDKHYPTVHQSLEIFDQTPLLFSPGEQFSYSSLGTVLLSAAMSGAADLPYLAVMQQQVFDPLKLIFTGAESHFNSTSKATFYWHFLTVDGQMSNQVKRWREVDLSHRLAGGGFISTSAELAKIGSAWLDEQFISEQTRQHFWQPQQLNNGEINRQNYALGWRFNQKTDSSPAYAHHGGVSRGAQSWLMVYPQEQLVLALNINATTAVFADFAKVSREIAQMFML